MANDPTLENGEPYEHDTFPPGTLELYNRVRELILAEFGDRIDETNPRTRMILQLVASRIVVAARSILRGEG